MFHFGAIQFKLMGVVATFDVVTFYGLICAGVFIAGVVAATRIEKRNHAKRLDVSSRQPDADCHTA